jgi:hypothetical protein
MKFMDIIWVRHANRLRGPALVLAVATCLGSCGAGQEEAVKALEVTETVAYWTVEGKRGEKTYIQPVVRFRVRNGGEAEADYIQAMAVFHREGAPDVAWGNAYEYSISGEPVSPGGLSKVITLRSDSTFFSKDEPKQMLENEEWEQVDVEIFLRVGASTWTKVTEFEVPRRLGAPGVERFLEPAEDEPESEEPSSDPKE